MEYFRKCIIFYLINGSWVTFGIFDWHILRVLNIKMIRKYFTEFLKFGPEIGIFFWELQLDQIIFLPNFSTATLKSNRKSKKTCPGFLDLEKIFLFCFLCHAKNKQSSIIWLVWALEAFYLQGNGDVGSVQDFILLFCVWCESRELGESRLSYVTPVVETFYSDRVTIRILSNISDGAPKQKQPTDLTLISRC